MSKHKTAEEKMHVSPKASNKVRKLTQRLLAKARTPPPIPPKGTNADNQYR